MKTNQDIRDYAKSKGVRLWEIADKLGINDGNFSRRLRKELPDSEKQKLYAIIDNIVAEKKTA